MAHLYRNQPDHTQTHCHTYITQILTYIVYDSISMTTVSPLLQATNCKSFSIHMTLAITAKSQSPFASSKSHRYR